MSPGDAHRPVTCRICGEKQPTLALLRAHHREKHPKTDTSDVPVGDGQPAGVTEPGELQDAKPDPGLPPTEPTGPKPKVAGGLYPWMGLAALGVYSRNQYDGKVLQQGTPAFIDALDEVAQENETVYKILAMIAMADSPTGKLIIASLALVVPMMANHRPDNRFLRTVTGGLRFYPGTNIPRLPVVIEDEEERAQAEAVDDFVDQARTTFEGMSEEDVNKISEAMQGVPEDVMAKLFASVPIFQGGMTHPEAGGESSDGATG